MQTFADKLPSWRITPYVTSAWSFFRLYGWFPTNQGETGDSCQRGSSPGGGGRFPLFGAQF